MCVCVSVCVCVCVLGGAMQAASEEMRRLLYVCMYVCVCVCVCVLGGAMQAASEEMRRLLNKWTDTASIRISETESAPAIPARALYNRPLRPLGRCLLSCNVVECNLVE